MIVTVTQYLRPDGRIRETRFEVSDDLLESYAQLMYAGCFLSAEVLTTGEISFTIEDSEVDLDFYIEEAVPNGPEVPLALERTIRAFDRDKHATWRRTAWRYGARRGRRVV